jgi:RHS repeat-associated protein
MKTLIIPMQFLVLLLAICIGLPSASAKDIVYTEYKNKVNLTTSTVINVIDPLYTQSGIGVNYVRNYTAIPTLVYNRNSKTDIAGNVWSYQIKYDLLYSDPIAGQSIAKSGTLFIEHNNTEGIYESIGIHEQVVGDVKLRIRSITPIGDVPHDIHLELKLKVERYDYLDVTVPITKNEMVLVRSSNNQVEVAWEPVEGAEYYELEWVFWDLQYNNQTSALASMDLETVFERAVSIETKATSHQFDLFYPAGIVYVRVRPIGRYIRDVNANYEHLKYGSWVQGVNPNTNSLVIGLFPGFEADKIWQVQRSFAENAKSKQVIQYFDEGMRGRQTLTNLSSDDLTIVNENVYDAEGRATLSILPVPVRKLIGKNPLQFGAGTDDPSRAEGGLISTGAIDYTRKDFDKTGYASPLIKVDGQGKEHVSNVYYSSENPFNNHIHRNYIPDAENFPVTQVKLLNDATGRIARQSGVGSFYQLGSDHETKYFYSNPTHAELRRLFGKNVGDEMHYRKNYVVDANGQISVSYIDHAGQTIATALAGKSPENVNTLSSELDVINGTSATKTIKSSIIGKNVIDQSENLSVLSHSIFCDEAPRTDKFTYTLKGGAMYLPHATSSICIGCQYQVNISLIDENGTTIPLVLPTASSNGGSIPIYNGITTQVINGEIIVSYNSLHQNTCVPIPTVDINFEATLSNVGSYILRKVLRVVEPNPNQLLTYLGNSGGLEDKQIFIDQYIIANWDPNECDDCNDAIRLKLCEDIARAEDPYGAEGEIGSSEYQRYMDLVQYYLFNTSTYPDCDDLRGILALETGLARECDAKLELMKQQITPAGDPSTGSQGCLYVEPGFWSHVYNTNNSITIESYDNNGNIVANTFSSPTQFTNFIQNDWQEHFVDEPEILNQHPEYCAYESYCLDNNILKSRRFDFELAGLKTWADAIDFGTNLQTPINLVAEQFTKIMDMDPFFTAHPGSYTQMSANLANYCTTMYTSNIAAHPANVMGCGNGCSSVICYINNILGDAAQYNPNNYASLSPPYNTINTPDITPLSNEDKWMFFRGIYAAEKAKIQQQYINGITSCPSGVPYTGTSACDPIINGDETSQWMNDNGGGSPSNLADVQTLGNSLNQNNCAAICLGNAQRWIGQLCPDMDKSDPQYQQLINHFVAFCTGECSTVGTDNPMGYIFDENLNPMDPNLAQAQTILAAHTDCGYDLITNQPPYIDVVFTNKTDVYEWNTIIGGTGYNQQKCDNLSCLFNQLDRNNIFPTVYSSTSGSCPSSFFALNNGHLTLKYNNFPVANVNGCGNIAQIDIGSDTYCDEYFIRARPLGGNQYAVQLANNQTGGIINPLEIQGIQNYNCTSNTVEVILKAQSCTSPSFPLTSPPSCANITQICSGVTTTVVADITFVLKVCDDQIGLPTWASNGYWGLKNNQIAINFDSVKVQCEEQQTAELIRKATKAYDKYLEDQLAQLTSEDPCMAFRETMTTEYTTTEHHYTLYYYDQAGNLIQTIPPVAVTPLPVTHFNATTGLWDGTDPSHDYDMTTTYQYNTLGQVVQQESPDGGIVVFWHDYAQRLRFSQNAIQAPTPTQPGKHAYTKFDAQGRTIEVGRLDGHGTLSDWDLNKTTFPETTLSVHEQIITEYEEASFSPIIQDNLRGRVARTYNDDIATYYDYDVHGNVKKIHHQIGEFGASEIEYEYDLLSGSIKEVAFMKGTEEQFFHQYLYDADNRITQIKTSKNGYIWDIDARYFYYAHGSLARVELGEDKVQGLDYIYNLQEWIKGVNNTTSELDLGKDGFVPSGTGSGIAHNYNKWIGSDQVGYYLGYHREDYKPIGTGTNLGILEHSSTSIFNTDIKGNSNIEGLYNGNIAFMISHIPALVPGNPLTKATQAMVYEYDALHRITKSESYAYTNGWNKNGLNNAYRTDYSYDRNGNIKKLNRHALNTPVNASKHIDDLTYEYDIGRYKNRLVSISDAQNTTTGLNDVGGTSYTYDLIGNLKTDGTNTIKWNLQNKVSTVTNSNYDIVYTYDVSGNRLSKLVSPKVPTNSPSKTTFYIRDVSGNIMGTYMVENDNGTFQKKLEETPIYGSNRLGIYQYDVPLISFTPSTGIVPKLMSASIGIILSSDRTGNSTRGEKVFEMSNHLGNVLVTISDLKLGYLTAIGQTTAQGYKAQVQSAQDYYPFGWEMPGRKFNTGSYRHGFNGKENDHEWGDQLIQDYGFRLYNPAIAKFLSVDPLSPMYPWYTPYQFAGNSPIKFVDLDGLEQMALDIHLDAKIAFQVAGEDATPAQFQKVYNQIHYGGSPMALPDMHTMLDAAGFIPVIGELADGTHAIIYLLQGDYKNAALSAVSIIPVVGDALGKGSKYGLKAVDNFKVINKINPCGCFVDSTQVKVDNGYKNISEIIIGDWVWAYNDSTGITELKEVLNIFKYHRDSIYKIYANRELIEATSDHPFYVSNKWIIVENLKTGDSLKLYSGVSVKIDSIVRVFSPQDVFNFTVKDYNTYFVSSSDILTHNIGPCEVLVQYLKKKSEGVKSILKGASDGVSDLGGKIFTKVDIEVAAFAHLDIAISKIADLGIGSIDDLAKLSTNQLKKLKIS